LADNLLLCPVGFAFLWGLSLHVVEFSQQHALVIDTRPTGRTTLCLSVVCCLRLKTCANCVIGTRRNWGARRALFQCGWQRGSARGGESDALDDAVAQIRGE
jgi:hypothetical protein